MQQSRRKGERVRIDAGVIFRSDATDPRHAWDPGSIFIEDGRIVGEDRQAQAHKNVKKYDITRKRKANA